MYYTKTDWLVAFEEKHHSLLKTCKEVNTSKLRLILGIGRSGTSWITKILSLSVKNLRAFSEPLYRIMPEISLSSINDRLAIDYLEELDEEHPIIIAYKSLLVDSYNWDRLGIVTKRIPYRRKTITTRVLSNPQVWDACLVKEVHSLLATESILKHFKIPTVLVIRNPVYIVDSILSTFTLDSIYLKVEYEKIIRNTLFLRKFNVDKNILENIIKSNDASNSRQDIIFKKIITVCLIQRMFKILAKKYPDIVYLSCYEDTCSNTLACFKRIVEFLGFEWSSKIEEVLHQYTNNHSNKKFSIHKIPNKQLNRPFKFLTSDEVNFCREIEKRLTNDI